MRKVGYYSAGGCGYKNIIQTTLVACLSDGHQSLDTETKVETKIVFRWIKFKGKNEVIQISG